jgi:hypothetical protein
MGSEDVRARCAVCGEALGVYEPIVVIERGREPRVTSRAVENDLNLGEGVVVHRDCYRGGSV